MNIDDYNDLPLGMSEEDIDRYVHIWLEDSINDDFKMALDKLRILCNRQGDTFKVPPSKTKALLIDWLLRNWTPCDEYYITVGLSACTAFCLTKSFFMKFFSQYHGKNRWEYEQYLNMSIGDDMDPWASWRKK